MSKFVGSSFVAVIATVSLAACGSSPGAATPPQLESKATGSLTFALPNNRNIARMINGKKPDYVSPGFTKATLWIDPTAATPTDFSASCPTANPACTITFSTTPGSHVLGVEIDDGTSVLAEGTKTYILAAGNNGTLAPMALNGVAFSAAFNAIPAGGAGTFTISDSAQYPITAPGTFDNGPITVSASDPGVTINPTTLTSADSVGNDYAFEYGGSCTGTTTFTVTFSVNSAASPSIPLTLTAGLSPSLSYGPSGTTLGTSPAIACPASGSVIIIRPSPAPGRSS
jgi:hypothetical protein